MRCAVFVVMAGLLAAPAQAQSCYNLETKAQRRDRVSKVWQNLKPSLDQVEVPPPDIAKYIESEKDAAAQQMNEARFNLLMRHPYYYPAEFQNNYTIVSSNIEAALSDRTVADEVVHLSVVLSRYEDLKDSLLTYYNFDANRQPRVVTQGQVKAGQFSLIMSKGEVLRALQCGVRQMREPEKP